MLKQTLSSGNPSTAQRYGGYTGRAIKKPEELFCLVASFPGRGKSTFIESCPYALRVDFDHAGTSHSNPKSVTIPSHDNKSWGFNEFIDLVDKLVEDAKNNVPERPKIIAIDTLDSLIGLTISAVLELERERVRKKNESVSDHMELPKSFHDLQGKRAWGMVYDSIAIQLDRLRLQGKYGVWLFAHFVESKVPIDDNISQIAYDLGMGALWKRVSGDLDMVAVLEEVPTTDIEKRIDPVSGKEVTRFKTERVLACHGSIVDPRYAKVLKARGAVPHRTALSKSDGWGDFVKQYENSVNTQASQA